MLAKVIAHAPTREEAAGALAAALAGAEIHGVTTNRDLLVRILRHPEFLAGAIDTGFLVRHDPAELGRSLADDRARRRHAVAAALGAQARRRAHAAALASLPTGWRNVPSQPQMATFSNPDADADTSINVGYRFDRFGRTAEITVDGDPVALELLEAGPDAVTLAEDGVRRTYRLHAVGGITYVDGPDGSTALSEGERFPLAGTKLVAGACIAPLPGSVVRVAVSVGDAVTAGTVLVAIEAMKMEHEVHAAHDGTVTEVKVAPGDQVDAGALLVVVDEGALRAGGAGGAVTALRIANCSGFYGDRIAAAREMVEGGPIDVLTGDYLAELTMLILYKGRLRPRPRLRRHLHDADGGDARHLQGTGVKVVANAGGSNPAGLAARLRDLAARLGVDVAVAHVEGDDILDRLPALRGRGPAGAPRHRPAVADAGYAAGHRQRLPGRRRIAAALAGGADVVVSGRVTDAALVVGPAAWNSAGPATTGTPWPGPSCRPHHRVRGADHRRQLRLLRPRRPAFAPRLPHRGDRGRRVGVITKHPGTGGMVSVGTVTAQLLYEIGGPTTPTPTWWRDFSTDRARAGRARPGARLRRAGPRRARQGEGERQPVRRVPQHRHLRPHRSRHRGQSRPRHATLRGGRRRAPALRRLRRDAGAQRQARRPDQRRGQRPAAHHREGPRRSQGGTAPSPTPPPSSPWPATPGST